MKFKDKRSGKIVFVSQCILNQNLRFPGIAVAPGACNEAVKMLLDNDVGIESMPCLERLGWGGVSRRFYFRYQPMIIKSTGTAVFPLLKIFMRLWLFKYARLCKREAVKTASHIGDYLISGYSVLGVIAVNDSPTDGVTKTIDLVRSPEKLKEMGHDPDVFSNPDITRMEKVIRDLCVEGTGIFMSKLKRELLKRRIPVTITGFDPWADQMSESRRIAHELGLNASQG